MNIDPQALICYILYGRRALYSYNKEFGLNKSDLEIMAFASRHDIFSAYDLSLFFNQMNVQQLRRTTQKLTTLSVLEVIRPGSKSKPSLYIMTHKGEELLNQYIVSWNDI